MVSQARAESWVREGAAADGAVAKAAARRKHVRYPPDRVPGAKLVAFSVEAGGRWDRHTLNFLKRAAGRVSERHPGLAALGGQGAVVVYSSWLGQLACVLQKANVACLRSAAAAGPCPVPGVRAEGGASGDSAHVTQVETDDWLAERIDQLLFEAAAAAAADLV